MLVFLAFWDLISVIYSYSLVYWWRWNSAPGFTIALLALCVFWLGGSYLIGRYTQRPRGWLGWMNTLTLGFFVLGIFVAQAWLFSIADTGTRLRGFLLPLIGLVIFISGIGHELISFFRSTPAHVVLLCTRPERKILQKEIQNLPDFKRSLIHMLDDRDDLSLISSFRSSQLSIAVSDQAVIPDINLEEFISLRPLGVRVSSLVDWAESNLQRVPPEFLSERWLLAADGFSLQPGRWTWRAKRFLDVFGALSLIIFTFPLLILAGLGIWLEDRGPIFYSQLRSGLFGDKVRIWKLRTMHINAEAAGVRWAQKEDPRITKFGAFLRRSRLDELPQLWAVLKGDLSLIGPRPERPELEVELEIYIPHYRVRHWIRPGLSGWAQVNYPYGNSVADSRVKLSYDLYYLRNAGLLLDLLILLKTIRLVLLRQGAQPQK